MQLREMTIGEQAPTGPGLLKGQELATTFSFLRPNDLVWNYVVGNYLKGEAPPPFDLLYWNGDSTNLPVPSYVAAQATALQVPGGCPPAANGEAWPAYATTSIQRGRLGLLAC